MDLIEILKHTDFLTRFALFPRIFYGFSRIFFVFRHTGNLLRSYARMEKIYTDFAVKNSVKSLSIRGCERSIAMNLCVGGIKICENPSQSVTVSEATLKIRVFNFLQNQIIYFIPG